MQKQPVIPLVDEKALAGDPDESRKETELEEAPALCLSGGGYRAMLFHLGSLWRLNELGYLLKLDRISSVSGGSITAGVLGMTWGKLGFDAQGVAHAFDAQVVKPVRALASETIDVESVLGGVLLPGSVADMVRHALRRRLFGTASLQDLPDRPRFVINATNLQSGALLRFSKPFLWDYRVGKVEKPAISLAAAVQASAAFPPVLAPARFEFPDGSFVPNTGDDLEEPPYTSEMFLADGGVYDNMGIETAWKRYKTILVSDAGAKLTPEEHPHTDWLRLLVRVTSVIDNQVRSLRKRQLIAAFKAKSRLGAYWSIQSHVADFPPVHGALSADPKRTDGLAAIPTRLAALPDERQERLINWGYAMCDVAMRGWVDKTLPTPKGFPYPGPGI